MKDITMTDVFTPTGSRVWRQIPDELEAGLQEQFEEAADMMKEQDAPIFFVAATGNRALAAKIASALYLRHLASWKTGDMFGMGGNCFFATTHAAIMISAALPTMKFQIVTGTFKDAPDGDPELVHAWLEVDDGETGHAVNVSNLAHRPGYVMDRETYLDLNHCSQVIQSISHIEMRRALRASGLDPRKNWENGERIRKFTKKLLATSMEQAAHPEAVPHSGPQI